MAIWINDSGDDLIVGGLTVRSGETIRDRVGVADAVKRGRLSPWYEVRIFDSGSLSSGSLNQADYLFRSGQPAEELIMTSLDGGPKFLLRRNGLIWIRGKLRSWSVVTGELRLMISRIPLRVVKDRYGLFVELKRKATEKAATAEAVERWNNPSAMSLQDKYFGIYQPITPPRDSEGGDAGDGSPGERRRSVRDSDVPVQIGRFRYLD